MDTKIMRRAAAIGVGLLLSSSMATAAQEPVGGYTWDPFEPPGGMDDVLIIDLSEGPGGGLAIYGLRGTGDPETEGFTVWTSGDSGQAWSEKTLPESEYEYLYDFHDRHEAEATFTATAHDGLLVAARTVPGGTKQTYILTSPDGVHWQVASKLKNVRADDLISTPDGLAMFGLDFRKAKGFGKRLAGHPTLWLSDDGVDWVAHQISDPTYKPKDEPTQLRAIARSEDGTWMAQGQDWTFPKNGPGRTSYRVWSAGSDLEWSEVTKPVVHDERKDGWRLFDSTPNGFLFLGWTDDREAGVFENDLWLTPDGADWEQLAETGKPGPEVAVSTGSGVIAWAAPFVWTDPTFDDGLTRIGSGAPEYTSSDGRTWQHDPVTDEFEGIWPGRAVATPDGHVLVSGRDVSGCLDQNMFCVFGSEAPGLVYIGTPE